MRERLTSAAEVVFGLSIVAGTAMVSIPLGLVVFGVLGLGARYLAETR